MKKKHVGCKYLLCIHRGLSTHSIQSGILLHQQEKFIFYTIILIELIPTAPPPKMQNTEFETRENDANKWKMQEALAQEDALKALREKVGRTCCWGSGLYHIFIATFFEVIFQNIFKFDHISQTIGYIIQFSMIFTHLMFEFSRAFQKKTKQKMYQKIPKKSPKFSNK